HIISEDGVKTNPDKTEAIRNWPVPRNAKDVKTFLGVAGYYRRFVEGFSKIARPLNDLTIGLYTKKRGKNGRLVRQKAPDFNWTPECQVAFETMVDFSKRHPNTKALVTHGGMNGVYEAIYHAVPIVGFPLYGDHYDTFSRVSSKGMAVILNISTLTSDELYDAVIKVINTPSYNENAKKISAIHKDKPMSASDTVVFWIGFVIKHDGQHLGAEAFNLSFIEYFLIDIAVFLFV
uniref:2-hydroxyacylsphingosine 1-beta-galactosyltransferase-like n=1 Tax=Saccoglossus kowalevskii TaxID=10224 RepID=A0ABM0MJH2_SACKO